MDRTQVFLCHRESITKLMPRPGTARQDIPFITVDNVTAKVSEGDIAQITCNYAGTDNDDNDPAKTTYALGRRCQRNRCSRTRNSGL